MNHLSGFDVAKEYEWDGLSNIAWLHLARGDIAYQKNALSEAQIYFSQACQVSQDDIRNTIYNFSQLRLALIYLLQGEFDLANQHYQTATKSPYNPPLTPIISHFTVLQVRFLMLNNKLDDAEHMMDQWELPLDGDIEPLQRQEYLTFAHGLLLRQQTRAAASLLTKLLLMFEKYNLTECMVRALILQSVAQYGIGNSKHSDQLLKTALTLSESTQVTIPLIEYANLIHQRLLHMMAASDEKTVSAAYFQKLVDAYHLLAGQDKNKSATQITPTVPLLRPKEQAILQLLAAGLSNKEIAEKIFVSPNTIKTHLRHIYEKLQVKSRSAAILKASQLKLIIR